MKHYKIKNSTNWRSGAGFTLIEATVAAGVFAIAATSIVGVYTSIQRLNKQSSAMQALEQNIRFLNEDLSKLIANGSIDYARYVAVPQPNATELLILDRDGAQVRIFRNGDHLQIQRGTGLGAPVSNFTGNDVRVLDFKVYIAPAIDPFLNQHPTVTIYLDFESNVGEREKIREVFQTTIATREYPD